MKSRERLTTVVWAILAIALLAFYTGFNTKLQWRFEERPGFAKYDDLAAAFLAGQLHLKEKVDPGRLASGDPLNPGLPYPYRFDSIIWDGKYYFQHAPFPALIHALWIRLTGLPGQTGFFVVLCSAGTVIVLGLLLGLVRKSSLQDSPSWIFWYCVASFALCGPQMYIASRPVVYNEAVCFGALFILAGTALLARSLVADGRQLRWLVVAGACFGAAVTSRAVLLFYPICFVVCYLIWTYKSGRLNRFVGAQICAFLAPVGLFVSLLLFYNYMRFGSFMEFGLRLNVFPDLFRYRYFALGENFWSLWHVPYQLSHYLFSVPELTDKFPYLKHPPGRITLADVTVLKELVLSVFVIVPVTMLVFPGAIGSNIRASSDKLAPIYLFCAVGPVVQLLVLSAFAFAAVRYVYDFLPLIFVLIFLGTITIWEKSSGNAIMRRIVTAGLALLFLGTVLVGIYYGRVGALQ